MPGGLYQLIMYGAQDIYLTGNINDNINGEEPVSWRLAKERNIILKLDEVNECCITYEIIEKDEFYAKCQQCRNIMSYDAALKWIEMKHNCPMCRINIYNIDNIIFRNQ